jgi:Domain of unknown function (DUF4833)
MLTKIKYRNYIWAVIAALTVVCAKAQEPNFPVPQGNSNQLFYLQRTPNANTVVYELNYKNGTLNKNEPIHVFWIRYGDQGQNAELSLIQRKFAYGIKTKQLSPENYEIRFNAFGKQPLYLKKSTENKLVVFASSGDKQIILTSIYLKINGGSFWSPDIEYAELRGTDPANGQPVSERIPIR